MKVDLETLHFPNTSYPVRQITFAITVLVALFATASVDAVHGQNVEAPPVKRIVFYNSGIGQIQHEGEISDTQSVTIKFSSHDVSDVLKSLVFSDEGGGTVKAIQYQPAPEAEDVAANELGDPITLAQLLQSHRGQTLELDFGEKKVSGKIFGVENRSDGKSTTDTIVLVNDAGLKSYPLPDVQQFSFEDPKVGKKLNQALSGIVKSRQTNQKQLTIVFDGEGKRDVKFAYVVDSPIWRMTYRLSWERDEAYLQGWAHVDNVSGVDWNEIQLELRNGSPRALHSEIFSPVLAERPDAGLGVYDFTKGLNLVTQWYGFGPTPRFSGSFGGDSWDDSDGESGFKMYGGGGFGGGGGGFGGGGGGGFGGGFGGGGASSQPRRTGVDIATSFKTSALMGSAGRAVKYTIEKPVSLSSGSSAAIPVLEEKLPGTLLSLFNVADRDHGVAALAIEIENKSDLAMVSGPVSIVRDNDFVGDSKLPRLDRNQKTLVQYGIDSAVSISPTHTQTEPKTVAIRLEGDKLLEDIVKVSTSTWTVDNRDSEGRTILLRIPSKSSAESVSPKPDTKSHDSGLSEYRFEAPAGKKTDFVITYTTESSDQRAWLAATKFPFEQWAKEKVKIDKSDLERLKKAIEITREIAFWRKKRSKARVSRSEKILDSKRIRQSATIYGPETEDGKTEVSRLKKINKEIDELQVKLATHTEKIDGLELERAKLLQ